MRPSPTTENQNMSKLITAYLANPSDKKLAALRTYLRKHPMATCLATEAERFFLRRHGLE